MTSFISVFCWYMGEPFWSCTFFLSIYPSSYSILIVYAFFPKKIFWFWILKKKIWLDRRKKYIPTWHFHSIIVYLPFSQYNHIQNFEEKKLFQHFANLIKIRSMHLLPILDLIIPPYTVLPLSVDPSFQNIFLSNYWWQKSDIWSQASYRYAISWEAFLEPSDSYFLFADLVGFYPHCYICTFFSTTIDGRNLVFGHKLHIGTPYHGKWQGYHKWALDHSSHCFN